MSGSCRTKLWVGAATARHLWPGACHQSTELQGRFCRWRLRSPIKRVSSGTQSGAGRSIMARAHASSVINAPIEQVWNRIRDFDGMPKWHPGIAQSKIEGGKPSDQVGCVRVLTLQDGASIREQLLEMSDLGHHYSYTILNRRCRSRTTGRPCVCAGSPTATAPSPSGPAVSTRTPRRNGPRWRIFSATRCIRAASTRSTNTLAVDRRRAR